MDTLSTSEHLPADPIRALKAALFEISASNGLSRLALAVSGGRDSMVLMHAMMTIATETKNAHPAPLILHVNHGLRTDACSDADFVEKEAKKIGFDVEVLEAQIARSAKGSLEDRSRQARYSLLIRAMKRQKIVYVLTAQHRDDLAETVMLQHLRGVDLLGMGGMPKERFLAPGAPQLVLRPFLELRARDLGQYAKEHGLTWREDRSNRDLQHRRNLVRNLVLPLLAKGKNGDVSWPDRLVTLSQKVSKTNRLIAKIAIAVEESSTFIHRENRDSHTVALPMEQLRSLPPQVAFHLLERQLQGLEIREAPNSPPTSLSPKVFARVLTAQGTGETLELRRKLHLETIEIDGALWVGIKLALERKDREERPVISVKPNDRIEIEDIGTLEIHLLETAEPKHNDCEQWLPAGATRGELQLRCAQKGERITPFGMHGRKLVSDLMQEARIPQDERWQLYVVADEQGILWIPRVRASERCRIFGKKGPFLRLRFTHTD